MACKKALIIGPAAVGKTLIFQGLVPSHSVSSSFFPGTEIRITRGDLAIKGQVWEIIDTPPITSFNALSLYENIVLTLILEEKPEVILQIMTPETIEENLQISIQLSEMGIPFLILLNKCDAKEYSDYAIDMGRLYSLFHVHIIVLSAVLDYGYQNVKKALSNVSKPRWVGQFELRVDKGLEKMEKELQALLENVELPFSKRFFALMLILNNKEVIRWVERHLEASRRKKFYSLLNLPVFDQWARSIYRNWRITVLKLSKNIIRSKKFTTTNTLNSLNKYLHHPFWGSVLFFLIVIFSFLLLSQFAAGFIVSFIETEIFSKYVTPGFVSLVSQFPLSPFIKEMLIGDYGLLTMGLPYLAAIIFPIVFVLFSILVVLEDSGYLDHVSILLNKFFSMMGLTGAAVAVFFQGLGCSVLAISKAKSLQTPGQHKVAAFMVVLAIPCISQMGIIINMLSVIPFTYMVLFLFILFAQFFIVGSFLKRFIPQVRGGFVQKVTPLRMPHVVNVLNKLGQYTRWYFRKAIPVFILATLFLFFAETSGLLELIERLSTPIITSILGLPSQSIEVFILGFLRRDYGAARLYEMTNDGSLNAIQVLVSLLVVTLSIPCISAFFTLIKEQGVKIAMSVGLAILFYTLALGSFVNLILRF